MTHKALNGEVYDSKGFKMNEGDIAHDLNRIAFLEKEISDLKNRNENGIGCMKALIEYVDFFEGDIEPIQVKAEAGEAILRLTGEYAK